MQPLTRVIDTNEKLGQWFFPGARAKNHDENPE